MVISKHRGTIILIVYIFLLAPSLLRVPLVEIGLGLRGTWQTRDDYTALDVRP